MAAVVGWLAMVLGVAVASADEVCTTPPLVINEGTAAICVYGNAFAYAGVTVTIKLLDGDGMIVSQLNNFPVGALATASIGIGCSPGLCTMVCRFEVTGNTFFAGYSRGLIENLREVTGFPVAGVPATCNPF